MQSHLTPQQSGAIIVTDPDGDFRSLNIPTPSNGQTLTLDLTSGDNALSKPRKIQMSNVPSATIITLASRHKNNGTAEWWLKLKTSHQPAKLNNEDVVYFVNSYMAGDFIMEGLGMVVVSKSSKAATRDSLGTVTVELSALPPKS